MRLRQWGVLLIALTTLSGPAFAERMYISDELYLWMRTSLDGRASRPAAKSGEAVEVLERRKVGVDGYDTRIRTPSGRTGWVSGKDLSKTPSAKVRVPQLEQQVQQLQEQVQGYQDKLTAAEQREQELQNRLQNLGQDINQAQDAANAEKAELVNRLETLTRERNQLQGRIDKMDEHLLMQWFMKGSLVMAGGILLGLILPLFFRRRRSSTPGWA